MAQTRSAEIKTLIGVLDADGCLENKVQKSIIWQIMHTPLGAMILSSAENPEFFEKNKANLKQQITDTVTKIKQGDFFVINNFRMFNGYNLYHFIVQMLKLGLEVKPLFDAILYEANKDFFHYICDRMKRENFDRLIIVSGSNRQNSFIDQGNSLVNGTRPFFVTLPSIAEIFSELLREQGKQCHFDPFLLANIFAGISHEVGQMNRVNEYFDGLFDTNLSLNSDKPVVFDKSKFLLYYAICNYFSRKYPDEKLTVLSADDIIAILSQLETIFTENKDFIPTNISLEFFPYNGALPAGLDFHPTTASMSNEASVSIIQGTAKEADPLLEANVLKLAEIVKFNPSQTIEVDIANHPEVIAKFREKCLPEEKCEDYVGSIYRLFATGNDKALEERSISPTLPRHGI